MKMAKGKERIPRMELLREHRGGYGALFISCCFSFCKVFTVSHVFCINLMSSCCLFPHHPFHITHAPTYAYAVHNKTKGTLLLTVDKLTQSPESRNEDMGDRVRRAVFRLLPSCGKVRAR